MLSGAALCRRLRQLTAVRPSSNCTAVAAAPWAERHPPSASEKRRRVGRGKSHIQAVAAAVGSRAQADSSRTQPFSGEEHDRGPLWEAMQQQSFPKVSKLDHQLMGTGCCVHIPEFGCSIDNHDLAHQLADEIDSANNALRRHRSGKHLQAWGEDLINAPTFTAVLARLLTVFNVRLVDCWANVYRDGGESKPWHHDNYRDRSPKPCMTIGLSLGCARDLAFEHVPTGRVSNVLQRNGDVFAFDSTFNKDFRHAVPPARRNEKSGLRISIIIWAMEGPGLAVPKLARRAPGFIGKEIRWDGWDLESGLWADSRAFS